MIRPKIKRFSGVDVPAYVWAPESPRFGIVLVHGMTEHAACYDGVAQWVVQQGGVALAVDHVGHGPSCQGRLGVLGPRGWDALINRVAAVISAAVSNYSGIRWIVLGHSMGSFVVQDVMARHGFPVSGIVLTGATIESSFATGLGRMVATILGVGLGQDGSGSLFDRLIYGKFNRSFAPNRTPFDWLSRDTAVVDRYIADPYCGFVPPISFYRALFGGLNRLFRPTKLSKLTSLPILVLSGAQDPVTRFGAGAQQLAQTHRQLGNDDVEVAVFPNLRHVILYERDNAAVYQRLTAFIQRLI